nr:hypothetical protein B0A51_06434 [Rachicladosporium sp. CCFEE 5018]
MAAPTSDGKRKRVDVDLTDDDHAARHARPSPAPPTSCRAPINRTSSYNAVARSNDLSGSTHSHAERTAWLAAPDEDEEDVDEILGSTQDNTGEGTDQLQHYGDVETKIVGCQYYRGFASPGEVILIRREPGNPYDSNAIRIDNVGQTQIGHIPRRMAEKLAQYIDNRWAHVEGKLAGSVGQFDCPIRVAMYGPDPASDEGQRLVAKMKADRLPIRALQEAERAEKQCEKDRQAAAKAREREAKRRRAEALRAASGGKGDRGVTNASSQYANQSTPDGDSTQPVMDDILEASQRFNPREASQTAEQLGANEAALKDMPMATQPNGIKTRMLPYQLQALHWLLQQESPPMPGAAESEAVQLWRQHDTKQGAYTNLATSYSAQGAPPLASGGILADDMGLGKTLEMISLLLACTAADASTSTTLIVAPLSVMSNWSDQIKRHIKQSHALRVYTYHGVGRVSMKATDFAEYDVVITTYGTLASDYIPRKGKKPVSELRANGLYSVNWRRIILDEGHAVRNPQSKGAAAVTAVKAKSRWVLTGTPIINSLRDLYSLLRFIGISGGLETLEVFNSVLVRPLKNGSPEASVLLRAIMIAFTLRRKKEMDFINLDLPPLEEYKHMVDLTAKERERYEAFTKEAQGMLQKFQKAEAGTSQAYQSLLEILLRMRQCCNHWQLCPERVHSVMKQLDEQGIVTLNEETKKGLQHILQVRIESQEDCPICLEPLHEPMITLCGHAFGGECISKVVETQHKCPMCRAVLEDESSLVSPANECGDDVHKDDNMDLNASSSKLESMMSILGATKEKKEKTIIFSQWTRFLDIVEARLDRDGYRYCRIDGTMSAQERDAALHALENDSGTTVMLASLGVCAVGLNLTAANQIILSDSWWAPAIEDQAVDRVHRLGQTKACRVFRLVAEKTIEDQVLTIQQEKRKLMRLAFGEKSGKRDQVKQGRLADIQRLLNAGA